MLTNKELTKGFKAYKNAIEIEKHESHSNFYSGSLSIRRGDITFNEFVIRASNDFDFGHSWLGYDHFEEDSPYKDFSVEQRRVLEEILKETLSKDLFWNLASREQVYYLMTNAMASWSNYNPLYFLSTEAEQIIKRQKNIDLTHPVSRHSLFQIRDEAKKKLLVFEHVVPVTVQLSLIQDSYQNNSYSFLARLIEILHICGVVCVITKEEDNTLRKLKLNKSMGVDKIEAGTIPVWLRYEKANIELSSSLVEVYGKMYR
jgi:hypothetical protein